MEFGIRKQFFPIMSCKYIGWMQHIYFPSLRTCIRSQDLSCMTFVKGLMALDTSQHASIVMILRVAVYRVRLGRDSFTMLVQVGMLALFSLTIEVVTCCFIIMKTVICLNQQVRMNLGIQHKYIYMNDS